jgi:hypothetical protein
VSFYFSAHEDDWLFMNPSAFWDVSTATPDAFIHITAGDAGLGNDERRPQASALSGARERRQRDPLHGGLRQSPAG